MTKLGELDLSKVPVKPYYSDQWSVIYHADYRSILEFLPEFDACITDPPYGLGRKLHDGGTWSNNPIYDDMLEWDIAPPATEDIMRVVAKCKQSIVWGANYFQFPPSRQWLSWDKINPCKTMADFELAWCSWDGNSKRFREIVNPDGKRVHPTQKPLSLMRWCISKIDQKSTTVLDVFAGSGTTLLAAKLEGRLSVGVEISEKYCQKIVQRLRQRPIEFKE